MNQSDFYFQGSSHDSALRSTIHNSSPSIVSWERVFRIDDCVAMHNLFHFAFLNFYCSASDLGKALGCSNAMPTIVISSAVKAVIEFQGSNRAEDLFGMKSIFTARGTAVFRLLCRTHT